MVILIEISHFSSPAHSSIVIPNPNPCPIFRGGISTRMWPSSMSPIAFNRFFSSFNCNLDLVTRKTQAFYVLPTSMASLILSFRVKNGFSLLQEDACCRLDDYGNFLFLHASDLSFSFQLHFSNMHSSSLILPRSV